MEQPRPAEAAIMAAIEQLLRERRFTELSVNDILGAAGVSRTSFYAHFGSRTSVLAACLRRVIDELALSVDPFIDAAQDDPATAIRISLERWVALAGEHGPLLRTVSEEWPHDERLRELWFAIIAGFSAGTATAIQRARATGAAPAGADAEALATCLMWGYERVLHVSLVGDTLGLAEPADIIEPLAQMMTAGVFGKTYSSAVRRAPPQARPSATREDRFKTGR